MAPEQVIQRRRARRGSGVSVTSPVLDVFINTFSDTEGSLRGRRLTSREEALTRTVFGNSIDYTRVRILLTGLAPATTPGNTIRLPADFSLVDARGPIDPETGELPLHQANAQLLIHEMTHVWQFQHQGPGYITRSLGQQLAATISRGSRNFAYAYTLSGRDSFFDFGPEQQAHIVENYYAMLRDQELLNNRSPANYYSNHMGPDGNQTPLSAEDRQREIEAELPLHEPLLRQVREAIPPTEPQLREIRYRSLMTDPLPGGDRLPPLPNDLRLPQTVKILEIRFP
ncbi:MAG: hypothetical protein ACK4NS_03140 [Saprospiraceae bacterium]